MHTVAVKILESAAVALTSPFAAELVRLARAEGHAAGLASGLERGRREAQTEIDGLTYERGRDEERGRIQAAADKHLAPMLPDASRFDVTERLTLFFAAIRAGEPALSGT